MRSARKKEVTEMQAKDKRVYEAGKVKEMREREEWKDVEEAGRTFISSRPRRRYLRQVREQTAFDHRYDNALFSLSLSICVSFLFPSVLPFLCSRTPLTLYFASSCCFDTERSTNETRNKRKEEVKSARWNQTRRDETRWKRGKREREEKKLMRHVSNRTSRIILNLYVSLDSLFAWLVQPPPSLRLARRREPRFKEGLRDDYECKKKARETIMEQPRLVEVPLKVTGFVAQKITRGGRKRREDQEATCASCMTVKQYSLLYFVTRC